MLAAEAPIDAELIPSHEWKLTINHGSRFKVGYKVGYKVVYFCFEYTDFFFMDGHPQATVVLFPCTQGFNEATMGITSSASTLVSSPLFSLFLAPWNVARGGSVA
jgi:hypothetical protein